MDTKRIDADVQSYDGDYYAWTQQQAAHLRGGRMDRVDLENLAEEIDSLGRSQEPSSRPATRCSACIS